MKDTNFAQIYGAGLLKKALMLDYISKKEWLELTQIQRVNGYDDPRIRDNPKLREVRELNKVYEREIPESGPLQKRAIKLATEREYICSILGRRSRFPGGARAHKALNTRIQPSGADIMKQKGIELHQIAKSIGFRMRLTVHDEFDGDIPDLEQAKVVAELLNQQSFKLRVPILWETNVGPNWYELQDIRET
jgi:DNA polymerase I-like protein with 3'-5' exonuclease and polymerase domains